MNRELWDHQKEALQALRQSIGQGVRRIVLSSPTGSGKTVLAAAIIEGAIAKGNRVCFVISNLSLVDQTVESFYSEGIRGMSVIQGDHEMLDWSKPVQIASIQTLRSRKAFPEAQVVIIDEVHVLHKCHIEWLQHPDWQKVPFIGLSATPYTKGLGKYFESLIVVATIQELIDKGVLCPFKVYATGHPNLDGVRVVAGDYVEKELSDAMQRGTLVADIVKTYKERWGKGKTLFYGVDRAHAQAVQKRFQEAGVKCGYQDALTPADERRELRRQFQNGEIEVLSNVSTLTTGTDVDCRCLILGRPTRSESLFQQIIGRALRITEGKDCIVRDTLILTDMGEIKIQDITLDHRLWDGVNFVNHSGAIRKGIRNTIEYDGLIATPDHRVMTDEGWTTLEKASFSGARITRSGIGGNAIRVFDNNFSKNRRIELQFTCRSAMWSLWKIPYGEIPQYAQASSYSSVPTLQREEACYRSEVALFTMQLSKRALYQSIVYCLSTLWSAWNKIQLSKRQRRLSLGNGTSWYTKRQENAARSYQQRRPLRTWKSSMGTQSGEYEQYSCVWGEREIHKISGKISASEICRSNVAEVDLVKNDGRRNNRPMGKAFQQTEREVWDIYNVGPLQRFTANGRLVHNCAVILDHSDSTARLGFVTDIFHDRLDDGKPKEKAAPKERLPKPCPQCDFMKKSAICPNCGFKPEVGASGMIERDGELIELTPGLLPSKQKKGAKREYTMEEKAKFFGELKTYAQGHNYKDGWCANKYREKFDAWPNHPTIKNAPAVPVSMDTRMWLKSRQIAWARSQAKKDQSGGAMPTSFGGRDPFGFSGDGFE